MAEVANGNGNGNGNGNKVVVPQIAQAGDMVRTDFGGAALERKTETASSALAAQATAAVQARFLMAFQRPRDIDVVRTRILAACRRPLFAKKAIYAKPVGQKLNKQTGEWEEQFAEGLSIRFAEEAIRNLGNAMTENITIYDDSKKRILRLSATDLETNVVHYKDITVDKTVERRKLKKGQPALGQRQNTYGDNVFIVEATEDDMLTKAGGMASKALRDKILMLIPSDIQEEARTLIYAVQAAEDAKFPEESRKAMLEAFGEVGISPEQLVEYLGHELTAVIPAELQRLRAIHSALVDGEATWADVVDQKRGLERGDRPATAAAATPVTAPAAAAAAPKGKAPLSDLAASAKAKREAAAKPGQQTINTKPAAASDPLARVPAPPPSREVGADDDDPDAANRAAAAPSDDEMPPWAK